MKKIILTGLAAILGIAGCAKENDSEEQKKLQTQIVQTETMKRTVQITDVREAGLDIYIYSEVHESGYEEFPFQIVVAKDPEGEKGFISIGLDARLHKGAATITYMPLTKPCVEALTFAKAFMHSEADIEHFPTTPICTDGIIKTIEYE
ncbi:hypothetical protein HY643_02520 [Candidatus Woesearchaeota archaeon]|nr:hypothetical protein [Candidatus Woesearchaeota archaeon]